MPNSPKFTETSILSLNTGGPKPYTFQGNTLQTSMRRTPQEQIRILFDRVEGDVFAGPHVHGVKTAVVYAYDARTFREWSMKYNQEVGPGNFGENLTLAALDESQVFVGDEWEVGTARLRSTSPRYPCNRLNYVFSRADAQQQFLEYRRPGVYFEVVREGVVTLKDALRLVKAGARRWSILDFYDSMTALRTAATDTKSREKFAALANDPDIPEMHRARFLKASKGE